MESTLKGLKAAYDRSARYVEYLRAEGLLANEGEVSDFWAQIFNDPSRTNYPDFNSVLAMRRGATYPLADAAAVDDATEMEAALAAHSVIARSVPADFLRSFPESVVGCPRCIEIDGSVLSAGGTINALTTYRILEWLSRRSLRGKPIRVLEIGAGYGQVAYQLCTLANVESYTIIDLPENLFLSSFYLQANFPDWQTDFCRAGASLQSLGAKTFRFLVPPLVDALGGEYDLILNSYSFQEMNLASVQRYFRLAEEKLAPGGFFYSLNSHGKSGVDKPSDYDTEKFEWLGFAPVRRFPHHYMFATTPYEMAFGRRDEAAAAVRREISHFDAIAAALQLGVFEDLVPLCDSFVAGTLTEAEARWLDAAKSFFEPSPAEGKAAPLAAMKASGALPEVTALISGLMSFAGGDPKGAASILEPLLSHFSGTFVDVRISLALASATTASERARWLERVNHLVPYLKQESLTLASNPETLRKEIAAELRLLLADSQIKRIKQLLRGGARATTG